MSQLSTIPVALSECFFPLPPGDHPMWRHLRPALNQHITPLPGQGLRLQHVLGEIWGYSYERDIKRWRDRYQLAKIEGLKEEREKSRESIPQNI